MAKAKSSKKQRKWGRNAVYCAFYRNTNRRDKNKAKRLSKHLIRFPADLVAVEALKLARVCIRGY
jgi:transposase